MTTKTESVLLYVLAILLLAAAPGFASTIAVANFSFETLPTAGLPDDGCGADCEFSMDAIPGWSSSGTSGQFRPGTPANMAHFASLSDGDTGAYSNGGTISQTVAPTVQAGFVYTLLVDVGFRLDEAYAGTAGLRVNGIRYAATGITPARGSFGTVKATYTGRPEDAGKPITIDLDASGTQGNFDNVRLSEDGPRGGSDGNGGDDDPPGDGGSVAPEPASLLLIAPGLVAIKALERRRRAASRV